MVEVDYFSSLKNNPNLKLIASLFSIFITMASTHWLSATRRNRQRLWSFMADGMEFQNNEMRGRGAQAQDKARPENTR